MQGACKVAVVSTYPPKKCGLATFTAELLARLRAHPELPNSCDFGVIAISDPSDRLLYTDPIVHYDLRPDSVSAARNPSRQHLFSLIHALMRHSLD